MFDLNEHIHKWRTKCITSKSFKNIDIDELESHLREQMNNFEETKISDEEKFFIATRRLGCVENLADEFAKINCSVKIRNWISLMISGIFFYMITSYFAKYVTEICVKEAIHIGISGYYIPGLIGLGTQFFVMLAIFVCGFIIFRYLSKTDFLQKVLNLGTIKLIFLLFLLAVIVYRIGFHIPVPGFNAIDVQTQINQALSYTQLLWSVLLPAFLIILLTVLKGSKPKAINT